MIILKYPHNTLRQISEPVECFDQELRFFIEEMKDLCFKEGGAGLSAVQVGRPQRILIYALDGNMDRFGSMVNPVINHMSTDKMEEMREGCLSVPDKQVTIKRSTSIYIKFQDGRGKTIVKKMSGLKAVIVQHEIDHLNGKLIVDYE